MSCPGRLLPKQEHGEPRHRGYAFPDLLPSAHASDLAPDEEYQIDELSDHELQHRQEPEDGKRPYGYFVDP